MYVCILCACMYTMCMSGCQGGPEKHARPPATGVRGAASHHMGARFSARVEFSALLNHSTAPLTAVS